MPRLFAGRILIRAAIALPLAQHIQSPRLHGLLLHTQSQLYFSFHIRRQESHLHTWQYAYAALHAPPHALHAPSQS